MAFALVAHAVAAAVNGPVTPAINTTGANLIVIVSAGATGVLTSSDNKSNTYTTILSGQFGGNARYYNISYAYAPTVGSGHTFSVTGSQYDTICVAAFSGAAASPLDQSNSGTSSSATTLQPGSITPTQANELIISGLMDDNSAGITYSVNSGFTITDSAPSAPSLNVGAGLAYLIQTSAAAVNPTWTVTSASPLQAVIASFKAAGSGGFAIQGDYGMSLAWSASIRRDGPVPVASAAALRADQTAPQSIAANIRVDGPQPAAWGASVRSDAVAPVGYAASLRNDQTAPLGNLSAIREDISGPAAWAASSRSDSAGAVSWGASVRLDTASYVAWANSIRGDTSSPLAWGSSIRWDEFQPLSWGTSLRQDQNAPLGSLSSIRRDALNPVAWGGLALTIQGDASTPLAWGTNIRSDALANLSWTSVVRFDNYVSIAWINVPFGPYPVTIHATAAVIERIARAGAVERFVTASPASRFAKIILPP